MLLPPVLVEIVALRLVETLGEGMKNIKKILLACLFN